jgi:hypothetical protein
MSWDTNREVSSSPTEQKIFDLVCASPHGITRDEIVDALYGSDPEGGPLSAHNAVSVHLVRLNKKLLLRGMQIKGWGHSGTGFHLWIRRPSSAPPAKSSARPVTGAGGRITTC